MKVLMAEDTESVRKRLGKLLLEAGGVELRLLGQDAALLLQSVAAWQPDVVILDSSMRGGTALAVLESIKKAWPGMAVVVSASLYEPYYPQAFLRLGADFFFDKMAEWEGFTDFLRARTGSGPPPEPVAVDGRGDLPQNKLAPQALALASSEGDCPA